MLTSRKKIDLNTHKFRTLYILCQVKLDYPNSGI